MPLRVVAELPDTQHPAEGIHRRHSEGSLVGIDPDRHLHAGLLSPADLRWWLAEDKQASGSNPAFYEVTSAGPVPAGGTARSKVSGTAAGRDMRFGVTSGRFRTLSPRAGTHRGISYACEFVVGAAGFETTTSCV